MCWSASAANNKRYVNIVVFKQVPGSGFGQVFQ